MTSGWAAAPRLTNEALERLVRDEWGQVVSVLVRDTGDLGLAEDAVQEAVTVALTSWPTTGVPDRPGAWITTTARRKALDQLRRQARLQPEGRGVGCRAGQGRADRGRHRSG